MLKKRKNDLTDRVYFRSERLFQHDAQWYFNTREGNVEGPFTFRGICKAHLDAYVRVMCSKFAPKTPLDLERSLNDAIPGGQRKHKLHRQVDIS